MKTSQPLETEGDVASSDITSWVSTCPGGLWEVHRKWTGERGQGDLTPLMGSVCKIKVRLKNNTEKETQYQDSEETEVSVNDRTEKQAKPLPRSQDSVLQIPLDKWFLLHMGEGQCDVIEGCLEGMMAGQMCELSVRALTEDSKPELSDACGSQTEEMQWQGPPFTLLLHSFTPGQESWEMAPGEKWAWVRSHKEQGSQRFGKGDVWGAADCYCRAVKLVITLKGQTKEEEEKGKDCNGGGGTDKGTALVPLNSKGGDQADGVGHESQGNISKEMEEGAANRAINSHTASHVTQETHIPTEEEYKTMKTELHCNLSLCQLKLGQPAKARDSSAKATELDPTNTKAWYRLGQASLQVEELGEARRAFGRVLELQPDSASARKALQQVNTKEKELDSKLGQRLSKMFN